MDSIVFNPAFDPTKKEDLAVYLPYVDPQVASMLYGAGYRETIDTWYARDGNDDLVAFNDAEWHCNHLSERYLRMFRAPSYQQVGDWLRERGVHIVVTNSTTYGYKGTVQIANPKQYHHPQCGFDNYYAAWRSGIVHYLKIVLDERNKIENGSREASRRE